MWDDLLIKYINRTESGRLLRFEFLFEDKIINFIFCLLSTSSLGDCCFNDVLSKVVYESGSNPLNNEKSIILHYLIQYMWEKYFVNGFIWR